MSGTKRRITGVVAVCTLAMTAAACSGGGGGSTNPGSGNSTESTGQPVRGGTLNMLGAGDVDFMDPNISYYSIGYLGLRMWSRQLFTYPADPNRTTTAVPDIATEIPTVSNGGVSKDGKTYTIHIRDGVKWNTNPARPVTAQDEVRGVMRTCNPIKPFGGIPDFATLIQGYQKFCDGFAKAGKTASALAKYMDSHSISGVQAKDDKTVVFKLTQPATYFVDMLTMPAFSPAPEEVNKYLPGSLDLAKNQISDGPYQVESYNPTKQIVYTRNPAWTASSDPVRKAYVDKIVVNETVTQDSTQQQLQTGSPSADMEFDNFPPASQLPGLIAKKDPNLNLGPSASTNPYLVFNLASPNNGGALAKVQVRQALSYAINRGN
ncbi:MAG TPA: ABC transporter substrate-binding protein, partial [Nocardioidaceae bacterium]|nr:ABC transporter substrate-binding protein [Nocardioidaceae bacterium]